MRIFILDDKQDRIDTFRQRYRGHDVTIVRQYEDAIRRLQKDAKYDLVCLDHDIADDEPANVDAVGRKRTGLDVVYYIADVLATTPRKPTRAIIHTHNVVRAPVMQEALEQVGIRTEYEPFSF